MMSAIIAPRIWLPLSAWRLKPGWSETFGGGTTMMENHDMAGKTKRLGLYGDYHGENADSGVTVPRITVIVGRLSMLMDVVNAGIGYCHA